MYHFCTYFDSHYLPQALALHASLQRQCADFRLYALCMDAASFDRLSDLALPSLCPIRLEDLERAYPDLVATRDTRSTVEYYFTCSPHLPAYLLERNPQIDLVTYLDADLFFFADPRPVFDELQGHSIGIVEHRFTPRLRRGIRNGIYNVGWVSFRNDANAASCLAWWRDRCLEWCYERHEDGRFSDQAYLDEWPTRFAGVHVIQHKGANVAPWNVGNYRVTARDGGIYVDDEPLIFYHFHGLKQVASWLYDSHLAASGARLDGALRKHVYGRYIRELLEHSASGRCTEMVRDPRKRLSLPVRLARSMVRGMSAVPSRSYILLLKGRIV